MPTFSDSDFRKFLGEPIEAHHHWGREWRFSISQKSLDEFSNILRDTLYAHHTFFNLHEEIAELGFALSAEAMKNRYSGNPTDHKTQMGNIGEIFGAHIAKEYLNFRGEPIYPKRYNTNLEQSQKGIDILGFKDAFSPAELLIGEVKTGKTFSKQSGKEKLKPVEDAYKTLCRHQKNEDLFKLLHFGRAYFRDSIENLKNIERHESALVPRHFLLLSITEDRPRQPFAEFPEFGQRYEILKNLVAVHIEIKGLGKYLKTLYERVSNV